MKPPITKQPSPLSNPTRAAMVDRLRFGGDADLDELAAAAGVHRNTVRAHAAALESAGVIERKARSDQLRAGRPRTVYQLTAAAQTADPPPLAELLGAALGASGLSRRQAQRLARLRAVATKPARLRRRAVAREVEAQLSDLGFDAQFADDRVELEHCPCPVVAPDNPAVVCALVAGTVDGTLERVGAKQRVIAAAHDPVARRCTLQLGTAGS